MLPSAVSWAELVCSQSLAIVKLGLKAGHPPPPCVHTWIPHVGAYRVQLTLFESQEIKRPLAPLQLHQHGEPVAVTLEFIAANVAVLASYLALSFIKTENSCGAEAEPLFEVLPESARSVSSVGDTTWAQRLGFS